MNSKEKALAEEFLHTLTAGHMGCIVGVPGEDKVYRPNPDAQVKDYQRVIVTEDLAEAVIKQCATKITLKGSTE